VQEAMKPSSIQDRSFLNWFTRSLLLHALFILAIIYSSKVFQQVIETRKQANIRLVESSVRVDVVAMPKMTLKELKAIGSVPLNNGEPAPAEPKAKTPDLNNSNTEFEKAAKKKNFMDMLKNMAKKNVPKAKRPAKKKVNKAGTGSANSTGLNESELKQLILAGNKLSKGSSLTGGTGGSGDAFTQYISSLPDMIRPRWKLPSYLMDQNLKCRIRIFLNPTGRLLRAEIYESSGNPEYDRRALDAVKGSSPFPELAESFKSRGINGDIVLGFPL
jgi:colicin import membrane protein